MRRGHGPLPAMTPCAKVREIAPGENAVMMLGTNSIIVILVIGLIAGWLAGKIMGGGFGIIGDIIIGIIGAFIGTWLWGVLHLPMIANFWVSAIALTHPRGCLPLFSWHESPNLQGNCDV